MNPFEALETLVDTWAMGRERLAEQFEDVVTAEDVLCSLGLLDPGQSVGFDLRLVVHATLQGAGWVPCYATEQSGRTTTYFSLPVTPSEAVAA